MRWDTTKNKYHKIIKPEYWSGFFWLQGLALIVDGIILICSFGFLITKFRSDIKYWSIKREYTNAPVYKPKEDE